MSDTVIVPNHLGIILDGNRRWAKEHGLLTLEGHRQGADVLKKISSGAFKRGVKYLSAFVFSTENWSRTQKEVSYLMGLVTKVMEQYLDEVHSENIRVLVLGSREGLDSKVLRAIEETEKRTASNKNGTLALCFNYGGEEELVDAIKRIVVQKLQPADIDRELIADSLYAPEIPPVDLLIRTSGEYRTSGFMLTRAAYAELYFTDKFWPDFTEDDLDKAFLEYASRQRRFGK